MPTTARFLVPCITALVAPVATTFGQCQPAFVPGPFTSMNGEITALAQFEDGRQQQAVYAGGTFTQVNGQPVARVLRWWPHTGAWEACDRVSGPAFQLVFDFEVYDDGSGPALFMSTGAGIFRLRQNDDPPIWEAFAVSPAMTMAGDMLTSSVMGDNTLYTVAVSNGTRTVMAYRPDTGWTRFGDPMIGPSSRVQGWSLVEDPAGNGLFIMGYSWFRDASNVVTQTGHAVRWDGTSWTRPVIPAPFPNAPVFQTLAARSLVFDDGHGARIFVCGDQPGSYSSVYAFADGRWSRLGLPPAAFPATFTLALTTFDAGHGRRLVVENYGGLMEWDGAQWSTIIPTRSFRDNGAGWPTATSAVEFTAHPGVRPILVIAGGFPIPNSPFTHALYITSCAPCPVDFDASGSVSIQDLLSYLQAWFAHSPTADFDDTPGVDLNDLFAYLAAWHVGCL